MLVWKKNRWNKPTNAKLKKVHLIEAPGAQNWTMNYLCIILLSHLSQFRFWTTSHSAATEFDFICICRLPFNILAFIFVWTENFIFYKLYVFLVPYLSYFFIIFFFIINKDTAYILFRLPINITCDLWSMFFFPHSQLLAHMHSNAYANATKKINKIFMIIWKPNASSFLCIEQYVNWFP